MIPDLDCLRFDKESIYGDLGFDKESGTAYLRFILRSTIESCLLLRKVYFDAKQFEKEFDREGGENFRALFSKKNSLFHKKHPFWPMLDAALNF